MPDHGRKLADETTDLLPRAGGDDTRAARALDDTLLGTTLDCYRLESMLGAGGMGRVYLARHEHLHRRCALKILQPERVDEDPEYVARFLNEGRAAAELVHPNIVTIHALGEARGLFFLEMEFVAGRSLRRLIVDQGRLDPIRAVTIAARLADGLAAAHEVGIVHRDLKPDNVLMTLAGVPKLADFGLCKRLRGTRGVELPGVLCGTPHYMSPEAFEGQVATPATDVYALGVTLYAMLTGEYPFDADSLAELRDLVTTTRAPSVRARRPDVSLEIAEAVSLLLERSLVNRPRDGQHALQLLQAILGKERVLDDLVRDAFRNDPAVQLTPCAAGRVEVLVSLADGRRQRVRIAPGDPAAADRIVQISSVCCAADAAFFEEALAINAEMPHGGIAIARGPEGEREFIVRDTYPQATVDAEEIRRSVHEIAVRADGIEKRLTGMDRN